jgi:hypothetical protein
MENEPKYVAVMTLPKGGKKAWSLIMYGEAPVPEQIITGSPVVMAYARYDDGTQVAGGVLKGEDPKDYNIKFMWVFDAEGNQYPGYPIDVGDHEDFYSEGYRFSLSDDDEEGNYLLRIVEASV